MDILKRMSRTLTEVGPTLRMTLFRDEAAQSRAGVVTGGEEMERQKGRHSTSSSEARLGRKERGIVRRWRIPVHHV
jgi:hypothetical protein